MGQVASFHFDMDIQMSVDTQGVSLDVPISLSGDYQAPDRFEGTLGVNLAFFIIEKEIISIGGTTYMRDSQAGEWEVIAAEQAFFVGPDVFVGVDTDVLENLAVIVVETVAGVAVYHLKGTAISGTFGDIADDFEVSFYIGVNDGLLTQIQAEGEFDLGEEDPFFGGVVTGKTAVSVTLKLSDFGKPVSIEAPQLEPTPTPSSSTPSGTTDVVETLR